VKHCQRMPLLLKRGHHEPSDETVPANEKDAHREDQIITRKRVLCQTILLFSQPRLIKKTCENKTSGPCNFSAMLYAFAVAQQRLQLRKEIR
jgi:hypothetical protein